MTITMFVPAIALALLFPCLLVSQQVGIAIRTMWSIWATQLLLGANYHLHDIHQKGDIRTFLSQSALFFGVASWLSSFWIMVTVAGLLLRTDVMTIVPQTLSPGADSSVMWQVVVLLMIVTNLMTHDYQSQVRQKATDDKLPCGSPT